MSARPSSFRAAAPKFLHLQLHISETDWAHSVLPESKRNFEKLKSDLAATRILVDEFEKRSKDQQHKLRALQHSHFTRVWHRTRGDLEVKIHEQEAISLQGLEKYQVAKANLEVQSGSVADARMLYEECQEAISSNERTKTELKELLEGLFGGPTPFYPSEDEIEQSLKTARANANRLQAINARYTYSIASLKKALQYLQQGVQRLKATDKIRTFESESEYNAIQDACDLRAKAASLLAAVHRFDPSIPLLQNIQLGDEPHIFSFLTADSYQLIDKIQENLQHAACILQDRVLPALRSNAKTVKEELQKCQTSSRKFEASLWAERTRIMTELLAAERRVAADQFLEEDLGRDDPPPAYTEIA